jgi:hypothetical protein
VTGVSHLRDAAWHRDGEVGRLLALLDRAGEEARVVGARCAIPCCGFRSCAGFRTPAMTIVCAR